MALVDTKQQRPNLFVIRRRLFYELIQKNRVMKRSALIELMDISVNTFTREYKLYLESFNGIIRYDEKTNNFLFHPNDVTINIDWCSERIQAEKQHVQEMIV